MLAQDIGGDAEEPGGEWASGVLIAGKRLQGAAERLSGQILRVGVGARAPVQVVIHRLDVAIVERAELAPVVFGAQDERDLIAGERVFHQGHLLLPACYLW